MNESEEVEQRVRELQIANNSENKQINGQVQDFNL